MQGILAIAMALGVLSGPVTGTPVGTKVTPAEAITISRLPDSDPLLEQDLQAFFGRRVERVDEYLNWYFSWSISYINSYVALAKVLTSVWTAPESWRKNVAQVLNDHQAQILRDRLFKPRPDAGELSDLINRHVQSRLFALEVAALAARCPASLDAACQKTEREKLEKISAEIMATRMAPSARSTEVRALSGMLAGQTENPADVFHMARPLASRIAFLVIRFTELASLVVLLSAGLRELYVPNTLVTRSLLMLIIAWGFDFGILSIEQAIYRDPLRQELTQLLDREAPAIFTYVNTSLADAEASFAERAGPIDREAL